MIWKQTISVLVFVLLTLGCLLTACSGENKEQKKEAVERQNPKESLLKVNKTLAQSEDQQIDDFTVRYGWPVKKTGTGLRYWIYEHGTGQKAIKGSVARIEYSVSLLNGETIYRSSDDGPKEFTIGRGGVESGLEEGILFLKEGDRAKFILPSHLAYGLLGDQDKIPARSVLVYDLKLLKIK
jgi:FKBP-type peptidyl-prolyl cis-trans isomerase